ncbi:MAG: SulP family sulfate permease [Saprospiraceae bacterium]
MNINIKHISSNIRGDLSGGLLAAIIGLPMGLAFGVQSGLGAQAGLYTAIILGLIAGFIGGTKTLISDPTGPMTVVAATVVSMGIASAGDLDNALPLIIGTFVLAGIFELIFGILDFGKYVKLMPYPVVSSFMAGIGLIIISMQIFPLLGHASPKGFLNIISDIRTPLSNLNSQALLLGGVTLAIIYLVPKITTKVPSILVALIISTVISAIFKMEVPLIGNIPRSLPYLHINEISILGWGDLKIMTGPAIMLGGLGVIDSLLTSVVADNLTKSNHDSRKTILGQGLGNIIVGLLGGIPGAGATMGTVTNIRGGGNSKRSGITKAIFLFVIIVGIADYIEQIPMAVLAGILINIGINIIDFKGIKMLLKVPKQDAAVWTIVLLFTLFDNLLNAVAVGFTLASILFIGRMTKGMKNSQSKVRLSDLVDQKEIPAELAKSIYVQNIDGPIFFGFANQYRDFCSQLNDMMIVIIRMENIPFMDQSGLLTLESVVKDWHNRGIQVYITGANKDIKELLINVNIVPTLISNENCFDTFRACIGAIKNRVKGKEKLDQFEHALLDTQVLKNRFIKLV